METNQSFIDDTTEQREHDLTMHVFTVSAGMVGVCLTAVGILRLVAAQTKVQTLGDDLLAINAILFVLRIVLLFVPLNRLYFYLNVLRAFNN